jgi:hypothetical protein
VPTVLRAGGFRVVIYLPPREHGPPHVHVRTADGAAVIMLARPGESPTVRSVARLRETDVKAAVDLVADHAAYLLACWRHLHDHD